MFGDGCGSDDGGAGSWPFSFGGGDDGGDVDGAAVSGREVAVAGRSAFAVILGFAGRHSGGSCHRESLADHHT